MNSNNLLRMALVIDTSHSRFQENLVNVIAYVINEEENKGKIIHKSDLPDVIRNSFTLEFTTDEINSSINTFDEYFQILNDGTITLSETGRSKIKVCDENALDKVVKNYISQNSVERNADEMISLINRYIYNCLDTNIEALLNVIKGNENSLSLHLMDRWPNEDRKIINDFIDWENEEKDKLLYKTVAFAVDYCRLTVKKDGKNFGTILNGKKFYLDANVIFRLMGINNIQRKFTTERFVLKCKEVRISLLYTSTTRKEVLESIQHHVNNIRLMMRGYKGNGNSLYKLAKKSNYEDDFLKYYLEWAVKNNSFGRYGDFEQYLKRLFYETLKGMKEENTYEEHIPEEYLKSYKERKEGSFRQENAEFDIQNVLYIKNSREKRNNTTGWNINEYLISADHKLIDWSQKNINSTNPIVVLPSVWYAIILKISGRTDEDEKAFSEFIKMRYVQEGTVDNLGYLISSVCNKAETGVLQDLLFDEICKNNIQVNNIRLDDEKEIDNIVDNSFEMILEKSKMESFNEGKNTGEQNGYYDGISRGEKIGIIKTEIEHIKSNIAESALRKRRRNIAVVILAFILTFVVMIVVIYLLPIDLLPESIKKILETWWKYFVSAVPSSIVSAILLQLFPIEIGKVQEIESAKVQPKILELERTLSIYDVNDLKNKNL